MNEGFGRLSHCLHGGESWIFYQTVPRPPWFPKSKVYGHTWNIYKFASYLWFKKSHNNREAVLNRSTSYSAVYNCNWNFSQTEGGCIKWHDERFSFDSPSNFKPEKRQTSHNSFYITLGNIHLSSETIKTKIKQAFIKTNTQVSLIEQVFFFGVAKAGSGN